ncbi:hypothetical protein AGMMS49525_05300 [Bacteroidia bacterium]|nr:hypothetical protein AGMMS49525_05300 [Bacteroidia bacterium]
MLNMAVGFAQNNKREASAATAQKQKTTATAEQKKLEAEPKAEEARSVAEEARSVAEEAKKAEIEAQQAKLREFVVAEIEKYNTEHPNNKVAEIQSTLDSLKILVCVLAVLVFGLFVFVVIDKNGRRNEILDTLTGRKKKGDVSPITEWKNEIVEKAVKAAKSGTVTSGSSSQPAKIDEQQFKQLFEACWANKQSASANTSQEQTTPQPVPQNQPKSFYADAIIDDKFNRVKETADENETNFELKLNRASDTTAKVVVYQGAYRRILANPSFLEGCEKQLSVSGNNYTSVIMIKEGIAQKDSDGKWRITTTPEVKIS